MVVIKLEVKLSSAKRSNRQLLPTPATGSSSEAALHAAAASEPLRWLEQSLPALTAISNQQQLYEVVVVLSLRHFGEKVISRAAVTPATARLLLDDSRASQRQCNCTAIPARCAHRPLSAAAKKFD